MKCQLLRKPQATMEACRVWKPTLGMSQGSLHCIFVKFYQLVFVSLVPVVSTPLISCEWAWWIPAVHPQHLGLKRINAEVASRTETNKEGDFLLDQSKGWTTQDLHIWGFFFAFLPWLRSLVWLSFPWTRLLAYSALPLLSHCHWNTKNPTYGLVSYPRLCDHPLWKPLLPCNICKYNILLLFFRARTLSSNNNRLLKKVKHPSLSQLNK